MRQRCAIILMTLCFSPETSSAAWDCNEAVQQYNSALGEIEYTMRRYARCVSGSQANDDCYYEFRKLKYAQDDFESAISEYQSMCK